MMWYVIKCHTVQLHLWLVLKGVVYLNILVKLQRIGWNHDNFISCGFIY